MKKSFVKSMLLFLSLLVCSISFSSFAIASEVDNKLTSEQKVALKKMEKDLKFIFEEASTKVNGKYVLNEQKAAEHFGKDQLPEIKAFIKLSNGEKLNYSDLKGIENPNAPKSVDGIQPSYMGCMKSKIMEYTGLSFLTGGMIELIEQKAWQKLAFQIVKIAGKQALKFGVAGFVASAAWYAATCIGK